MTIWQADFYKRPLKDNEGEIIWELLICDLEGNIIIQNQCSQANATPEWLISQLEKLPDNFPEKIQVFRPQSLSLLQLAGEHLGIIIEPNRNTVALKNLLQQQASQYPNYNPIKLEKMPPQPLPENLWGQEWRFGSLPAGEIVEAFSDRPIPILNLPESLFPINLGLPSNLPIPGMIIYGGKQSLKLAQWLQEAKPDSINYIITEVGESGGIILESGLTDRWILVTFEDHDIAQAAQVYQQRKQEAEGLHFLLIQPDDSGMTYSGFWLLKGEQ
jgi:hypothetical protein